MINRVSIRLRVVINALFLTEFWLVVCVLVGVPFGRKRYWKLQIQSKVALFV